MIPVAMQVAAREARLGNGKLATDLRDIIDQGEEPRRRELAGPERPAAGRAGRPARGLLSGLLRRTPHDTIGWAGQATRPPPSDGAQHPYRIQDTSPRMTEAADIRDAPAYTFLAAARCLGMPQATLRYWVRGRASATGREIVSRPPISAPAGVGDLISFNNLVEAHVLRALRIKNRVRMTAVRAAIDCAERELGIARLLLRDELRTSGRDILLDRLSDLITLSRSGQLAMRQMLAVYLRRVDRDGDALPHRLYPLRPAWSEDRKPVVIDPRVSFGRPTVEGSGISTAALVDRLDAGESVEALAHDYRLAVSQVRDAVFYERAA